MADRKARKEQEKLNSKVSKFLDKSTSLKSRYRALLAFLDRAPEEELRKFFNEHFFMIYGVFLEQFSAYESQCKRNKHDANAVNSLLNVLSHILKYLKEYVQKGWQIRSIANVLEKALYIENKHAIRKVAFELLLEFLELVYGREEAQIDLLGSAIDLTPFTADYRDKINLPVQALQAPDRLSVFVPCGTAIPTIDDSVQLLECLLNHITHSPAHFRFWYRSLKEHFLNVFYPQVAHSKSAIGFRPFAPIAVQEVLIPHLERWVRVPANAPVMWTGPDNQALLLEIYCQSCHLPVTCDKTIKRSITLFRQAFVESPPKEIAPKVTEYRQLFLQKLATIFSAETPMQSVTTHVSLCLEVLQVFKYMFAEAYETLSPETQEVLLYTLLNTSTELLAPSSPNPILVEALASVCIDTVLFIWIRTKSEKPEHWQALQDGIAGLFHTMETIEPLKVKVVQLSLVICSKIYPIKWKQKKKGKTGGLHQKAKAKRILSSPDTVPPPKLPAPDLAITKMQWNVEEIVHVWTNMLNIFSRVNQIKDPNIHRVAINVLTEIIAIVADAEAAVPFVETLEENRPKPLYLVNLFGPWLFEACELSDTYVQGKAEAYRALCRMFCRHHQRPLPLEALSRFYAALHTGLTVPTKGSAVQFAILESANNIFNLSLPGASVLIPYFLDAVRRVLSAGSAPLQVQRKAVLILGSLVCYSSHFEGLKIPVRLDAKYATELTKAKELRYDSISAEVVSIVLLTMRRDGLFPELQVRCIWLLCVILFEELSGAKPDRKLVGELVNTQLRFCLNSNTSVARAALDALGALTTLPGPLCSVDSNLPQLVVETLANNILRQLGGKKSGGGSGSSTSKLNEQIVVELFSCLSMYVMTFPAESFHKQGTVTLVFKAIEVGILGQQLCAGESPLAQKPDTPSKPVKSKRKSFRPSSGDKQSSQTEVILRVDQMFSLLTRKPVHGSDSIRCAAEVLLHRITHHMSEVPGKHGIQLLESKIVETDDVPAEERLRATHFLVNHSTILSLVEVPQPAGNERVVRVIVRNLMGRFAWEKRVVFDPQGIPDPLPFGFLDPCPANVDISDEVIPAPADEQGFDNGDKMPAAAPLAGAAVDADGGKAQEEGDGESDGAMVANRPPPPTIESVKEKLASGEKGQMVDQLDDLLRYLSVAWPDCLPENGQPLNLPAPPLQSAADTVKVARAALTDQAAEDKQVIVERTDQKPPADFWMFRPPSSPVPQSYHHLCRLWLAHLGLLDFERRASVVLLDSAKAERSLATLDRNLSRDCAKVAIVKVAYQQDSQDAILCNGAEQRTGMYLELVRGLGWPVDLLTHPGYVGGLDNSERLCCGEEAPFFADSGIELIWHEIASIPNVESDVNHVNIKRHVGNDNVHIVYSEHVRDYNCNTIVSEFNDAHIVIYPLETGLFRIHISRKNDVELFGPLMHGMAISKRLLAPLARITALLANKYVRLNAQGYRHPVFKRRDDIQMIAKRYTQRHFYEEFMTEVIEPPAYVAPQPRSSRTSNSAASVKSSSKGSSSSLSSSPPSSKSASSRSVKK